MVGSIVWVVVEPSFRLFLSSRCRRFEGIGEQTCPMRHLLTVLQDNRTQKTIALVSDRGVVEFGLSKPLLSLAPSALRKRLDKER